MEFRLERATPSVQEWVNGNKERVVIINRKEKPVMASGSLMLPQINAVVEAAAQGLTRVQVAS